MNGAKLLFANALIAVWDDGSYMGGLGELRRPQVLAREPMNAQRIVRAKRARELGLPVTIPSPVWEPDPNLPTGGSLLQVHAVFDRAWMTFRFNAEAIVGKRCVSSTSRHGDNCRCGNCPMEHVYSNENVLEPAFEPAPGIIPEKWYERGSRTYVRVQTDDGQHVFTGCVRGHSYAGYGISERILTECGVDDPFALQILSVGRDAREKERSDRWALHDAEERVELAKEFGINVEEDL